MNKNIKLYIIFRIKKKVLHYLDLIYNIIYLEMSVLLNVKFKKL